MDANEKPIALERRLIYASPWVNLYADRVQFPNGRIIDRHHLVDFEQHAVAALARSPQGSYLMVKVCRYTTGRTEWEFPAGRIEAGEDVFTAAARELLEETGFHSTNFSRLYTYSPMVGIANQVYHIVRCSVTEESGSYDEVEISGVRWVSVEEIWQMIQSGEMQDGLTLTAFLLDQRAPAA